MHQKTTDTTDYRCLICGSVTRSRRYRNHVYLQCTSCRFRHVPSSSTGNLYENNIVSTIEYYKSRIDVDRRDFLERLQWIKPHIGVGSVLDVGANIGTFCITAKELGWKPVALELNQNGVKHCQALGLEILDRPLSELSPRKFDFIHLSDVIEHAQDPKALLQSALAFLRRGGIVFISTPDFGNPAVWPIQFTPPEHLSLFTKKNLLTLLESQGLRHLALRRRSRTRAFSPESRNIKEFPWIGKAYRMIESLDVKDFVFATINFVFRENLEVIAKLE